MLIAQASQKQEGASQKQEGRGLVHMCTTASALRLLIYSPTTQLKHDQFVVI